jgi:hypothetical protein
VVDSFPVPVCRFARATRCRRFRGEAAYGKDLVARQTFYGFRVHVRMAWPGLISRLCIAPANVHELSAVPDLTDGTRGVLIGDRNYWSPALTDELASHGLILSGAVSLGAARPLASTQLPAQPFALPDRTPSSASLSSATAPSASGRATSGISQAASYARSSATPSPSCSLPSVATRHSNSIDSSPKGNLHIGLTKDAASLQHRVRVRQSHKSRSWHAACGHQRRTWSLGGIQPHCSPKQTAQRKPP